MKLAEAEMVMEYCADIRRKRRMIERRRAELSDEISSLRGMGFDGMPRGSQPGDSTAAMACRMEELGISEELRSLDREEASLRADEVLILEKLRTLHSVHSEILTKRYIYGFTWEQVKRTLWSAHYSVPSLKRKRNEALVMLGEKLEKAPEKDALDALLERAYNARKAMRAEEGPSGGSQEESISV